MKAVLPSMLGALSMLVLIAGSYYFPSGPESIVVKLTGWSLLALTIFLVGPRVARLMKSHRRQVDEHCNPSREP